MDMTALPHRRLRATAFPAALVALGLALAGCEGVKDQLGLTKQSPDEFSIVTRAPLTLPPNFSLRPPAPGERRPQEATAQERAKLAIYGAGAEAPAGAGSAGEQALLSRAGAGRSTPDIRRIINEENAIYAEGNETFVDRLISGRSRRRWARSSTRPGSRSGCRRPTRSASPPPRAKRRSSSAAKRAFSRASSSLVRRRVNRAFASTAAKEK